MATFLGLVQQIEAGDYEYPHEKIRAWQRAIGFVDQAYELAQRRYRALDASDPATRDAVAGHPSRPKYERSLDALRALMLEKIEQLKSGARPTQQIVTSHDSTLPALSYELDVNINDLVALNPDLLVDIRVPKGSTVVFYAPT